MPVLVTAPSLLALIPMVLFLILTLRGKNCAICDSYDGAVYDRKKWNVKWKNFYFT